MGSRSPREWMRFALSGVMVVLAVAAIAPRFADSYWWLEFPGHLRAHLAIGALLMTILFVAWQAWRHVGLCAALTALLAAPVLALWVPAQPYRSGRRGPQGAESQRVLLQPQLR